LNTRVAVGGLFPGYPNPRAPATAWSGCREPAPWNEQRRGNRPRRLPARRAGLPRSAARPVGGSAHGGPVPATATLARRTHKSSGGRWL